MFDRWNFTVCSVTHSILASWALESPSATSFRISSSRRVKPTSSRLFSGFSLDRPSEGKYTEGSNACRIADLRSSGCVLFKT